MKTTILLLFCGLMLVAAIGCPGAADAPDIAWKRTYWETVGNRDEAFGMCRVHDGGFVIVGQTFTGVEHPDRFVAGHPCVYAVRTNADGDALWLRMFQGEGTNLAQGVIQTSDGEFLVTGYTEALLPDRTNGYLLRLDAFGDTVWTRIFGGDYIDITYEVVETRDSCFAVVGLTNTDSTENDAWLCKFDRKGNLLWQRHYHGWKQDVAYSLKETPDRGFVLAGYRNGQGVIGYVTELSSWLRDSAEVWVIKTDSVGEVEWERSYGGDKADLAHSVCLTQDGGYVVAGLTRSYGKGQDDAYILRLDPKGDTLWTRVLGGTEIDAIHDVTTDRDGDILAVGRTSSFTPEGLVTKAASGPIQVYAIKLKDDGTLVWEHAYSYESSDIGYKIAELDDGGYIMCGSGFISERNDIDAFLIRTKPD